VASCFFKNYLTIQKFVVYLHITKNLKYEQQTDIGHDWAVNGLTDFG